MKTNYLRLAVFAGALLLAVGGLVACVHFFGALMDSFSAMSNREQGLVAIAMPCLTAAVVTVGAVYRRRKARRLFS